jgi:putative PEP-CTERM system TPR-repeat lipoprotein
MSNRSRLALPSRGLRIITAVCGAGAICALAWAPQALAKTTEEYLGEAGQYVAKGDLTAAEIELRNAEQNSPNNADIRIRLATIYLRLGDDADAEREARTASKLGANDSDALPITMEAMLHRQNFAALLAMIPASDRAPALESKVRNARGIAYTRLQDFDRALSSLQDAVRLDESALGPKLSLTRVYIALHRVNDAASIVDEVLAEDPKSAEALLLEGQILVSKGDVDGALAKVDAAVQINPKYVPAHLARANIYLIRGDSVDADKDLDPILAANPENPMAGYLRALELTQKKELGKADEILTRIRPDFPQLVEGYFLQGAVKYMSGNLEQAEESLKKYVARVPDSSRAIRVLAAIALKRGAPDRAIEYLKPLADKAPRDIATLSDLGNAYMADHKPDLALAQFQAAAALSPDNLQMKARLAVSEIDAGQGTQGLALLENVYGSESGQQLAGPVLTMIELRAGHLDKAGSIASALVAKDTSSSVYQTLLGLVRFAQHDYTGAETAFHSVVTNNPDSYPATRNLAQIYIAMGHRDEAKAAFEALTARKPTDSAPLLALADLFMASGDWKGAQDYISRARSAAPNDPKPSIRLIDLYLQQKDYQDAKAVASGLLAPFPNNVSVLDAEARVQLAGGDAGGAAATYRRAVEADPKSILVRNRYVAALLAAKDFSTAQDVLSKALATAPNSVEIKAELIRVAAQIGGIDAGIGKANEFSAQDPKNPAYDLVIAGLYEAANRIPDAIALLEKSGGQQKPEAVAVSLAHLYLRVGEPQMAEALLKGRLDKNPGDLAARLALANQYLDQKQDDQAIQQYDRIVGQFPTEVVALNNLAWLNQQKGDMAKARETAERAVAVAPQNAAIADTLGWIIEAQGDNSEALKYLKIAGETSQDPNIQYHLAVALQKNGQSGEAKALLQKVLRSDANFPSKQDAQKLLEQLTKG